MGPWCREEALPSNGDSFFSTSGRFAHAKLARISFCPSTVDRSGSSLRTTPCSSIITAGRLPSEGLARGVGQVPVITGF